MIWRGLATSFCQLLQQKSPLYTHIHTYVQVILKGPGSNCANQTSFFCWDEARQQLANFNQYSPM